MGVVVRLKPRHDEKREGPSPREELPLILASLVAAGATDFAQVALTAWGKKQLEPEELLELCTTYAAISGLVIE